MSGKQVDLFLDSLINAPFKDDRALMEFPFFSLQKAPRRRPLVYDDGKVKIEINQTYPLSETVQAHKDLVARKTTGSTILLA